MKRLRWAILAAAALWACDSPVGPADPAQLEEARALWLSRGSRSYTYELSKQCFCVLSGRWIRVTVEDGSVLSAEYVDSKTTVEPALLSYLPSIPDLFDLIADALARQVASFGASYDPTYGYPASIAIDYSALVADDEVGYSVRAFTSTEQLRRRP